MTDLATDDQRWLIFHLFEHFGVKDVEQIRADAMRILQLEYLPDLRELTKINADELIAVLRGSLAKERVSGE